MSFLACRHFLYLMKKSKEIPTSHGGLSSSATLEKKKTDEDKPLGLLSSSTPEKKKERNDNELGNLSSFSALEEKTKKHVLSLHFSTIHFVCIKYVCALGSLWYFYFHTIKVNNQRR